MRKERIIEHEVREKPIKKLRKKNERKHENLELNSTLSKRRASRCRCCRAEQEQEAEIGRTINVWLHPIEGRVDQQGE